MYGVNTSTDCNRPIESYKIETRNEAPENRNLHSECIDNFDPYSLQKSQIIIDWCQQ